MLISGLSTIDAQTPITASVERYLLALGFECCLSVALVHFLLTCTIPFKSLCRVGAWVCRSLTTDSHEKWV